MKRTPIPFASSFTTRGVALLVIGSGLIAALSVAHAAPQDALGTGRALDHKSGRGTALDRNLQHGSGGINAPGVQEDLRARNLVVTGNVAGGRGFRGDVGYTAERDFRGRSIDGQSSDDVSYAFRAGSAYSDPQVIRAGTMGDRLALARSYGSIEYSKDRIGSSLGGFDPNSVRLRFDQGSTRLSTPESRRTMMDLSTAGTYDLGEGQRIRLQTGAFRGVRSVRETDAVDGLDLGLYDTARLKHALREGTLDKSLDELRYHNPLMPADTTDGSPGGRRGDTRITAPGIGTSTPASTDSDSSTSSSTRITPSRINSGIASMDSIVKSIDRNLDKEKPDLGASESEQRRDDFSRDLEDLRHELRGGKPRPERDDSVPTDETPVKPDRTGDGLSEETRRSLDDMVVLLRHGERIESLSEASIARIREILSMAESAMKREAYFLAEQHFTTALALQPGNPLARAGLANAQLGAGLNGSASITLRDLFASNPELIDVRFAPELLPSEVRMRTIIAKLEQTPVDSRNAADVGVITAYLGRQLEDRQAIDRGLSMMKGTPGDEVLAKLLRGIWLGEPVGGAPSGTAAPAEPSAPPAPSAPAAPQPE